MPPLHLGLGVQCWRLHSRLFRSMYLAIRMPAVTMVTISTTALLLSRVTRTPLLSRVGLSWGWTGVDNVHPRRLSRVTRMNNFDSDLWLYYPRQWAMAPPGVDSVHPCPPPDRDIPDSLI